MGKCEVKKGIFVLSACGSPASVQCDDCGIFICQKHTQNDGPKVVCADCYAKSHPEKFKTMGKGSAFHDWENNYYNNYNIWYFGMRHSFYSSHHYRPFDEHDYTGFDRMANNEFTDDQDGGSFFDS